MILLHKLGKDGKSFHLNPDLIERLEAHPDTCIVLRDDRRINVAETVDEVLERIAEYRASILRLAFGGQQ